MMKNDGTKLLAEQMAKYYADPLGFVYFNYPWGKPGTILEHEYVDDWQADYLRELGKQVAEGRDTIKIAAVSGHGVGKAQPHNLQVVTPNGMARWGDIHPGDCVFGGDGESTKVIARHEQGVMPIYKVTFDDGSATHVTEDHLWNVRGRQERRKNLDGWRTMSTKEIMEAGVKRPNGTAEARQWEIPIQGAAEFTAREVSLHPYFVGLWLGDGTKGIPAYTKPFDEIADRLRSFGYEVHDRDNGKTKYVVGINGHLNDYEVFKHGSSGRYIPDDYKYNTVEIRTEVLRGLFDTDGEIGPEGTIGYSSTSERLLDDVIWLARSLGGKATKYPAIKHGWYSDENGNRVECRDCWRATINLPFNPFTIKHRKERYNFSEARYTKRWIDSIEYDHDEQAMCITVDAEDGLYQTNDFIVTHNSSLVAWIIDWFMATRLNPQIIVTANTGQQLEKKTWRELAKWHGLAVTKPLFTWTATKYYLNDHPDTWFATAITWSKEKSEAFAGAHEKHILIIFDEASSIDDVIWEVTSGAMSTKGAIWLAFGNPTRNVGSFFDCFHKLKHRWENIHVDSRNARMTNKTEIQSEIEDHGIDSDRIRVRWLGLFPRHSVEQFIGIEEVENSARQSYPPHVYSHSSIIIGVDVARYGDDRSSICARQGLRVHAIRKFNQLDTMKVTDAAIAMYKEYDADAIMVDGVGIGAGVVDRLKQLGYPVFDVVSGSSASDTKYFNKRAEMWDRTKQWLKAGGWIPDDPELKEELTYPEYFYTSKDQLQIESKDDMKKRNLNSPDVAESLVYTFAEQLGPRLERDEYEDDDYSRSNVSVVTGY